MRCLLTKIFDNNTSIAYLAYNYERMNFYFTINRGDAFIFNNEEIAEAYKRTHDIKGANIFPLNSNKWRFSIFE